jgi:hydroxymethylbilane synthase
VRIGTRGSALALAQAGHVADLIGGAQLITTAELRGNSDSAGAPAVAAGEERAGLGSPGTAPPPHDKARWVRDLELALLEGSIDLAVHSAKDLPTELPDGLALLGAPPREPAEDVLCGVSRLEDLAPGARVGTGSLRRAAQLLAFRDDLEIVAMAGNVDTRLAKLRDGVDELDAIALALAGLARLQRIGDAGALLDSRRFVPAPGQGALALEGRCDDSAIRDAAQRVSEPETLAALRAERALARALGASCHTPIGAHARVDGAAMHLRAWVGLPDGSTWCADELTGDSADHEALAQALAARLNAVGAGELLRAAEAMSLDRA